MNTHTDTLITVLHSSIGGGVISTSDRRCNVSSQLLCSSESHSIILKLLLSANHKLSDMNLSPYTVRNHSSSETLALYVAAKWKRGFKTPSWEPLRDMTCHVLVNPCCKVSLQAVHLSRHNSLSWWQQHNAASVLLEWSMTITSMKTSNQVQLYSCEEFSFPNYSTLQAGSNTDVRDVVGDVLCQWQW